MPFLQEIQVENYKCLRSVRVAFSDLTALVGPNASGKSAVIEAVGWTVKGFGNAARNHDPNIRQRLKKCIDGKWYEWNVKGLSTSTTVTPPGFSSGSYQLDLTAIRRSSQVARSAQLGANGSEAVNVFETLTRNEQIAVAQDLCRLVPVYSDLDTVPSGTGQKEFRFHDRWNPDVHYRPSEVSDGTILVLAFLLLAVAPDTPPVVCIEEPERGLHPYLIEQVVVLLRSLARGELGNRPVQVILATQSAELLNYLEPEEVRFLERDDGGGTVVKTPPTDDEDWPDAFDAYEQSLRNAWLSGAFGAVPGRT